MSAPENEVPDSVTYREVREILRTFTDSAWSAMTLELPGMRITVGRDGPPASATGDRARPTAPTAALGPAGDLAPDPASDGAARPDPASDGPARPDPASDGPARPDPASDGAAGPSPAVREEGLVEVCSPAVGAFWVAPGPGQPPFVTVGQTVAPEDQLAIVEVMKLMNPVLAGRAGEVVRVCAGNSELVEYEQVLFLIRPTDG